MNNLTLESFFTYLLLLVSLICSYYVIRKATTALRYRVIVLILGIVSLILLTWGLVDNKMTDYQDANIGLGLIFFLTWTVIVIGFLFSIITYFFISRKGKIK